jgi:hypothetical protein
MEEGPPFYKKYITRRSFPPSKSLAKARGRTTGILDKIAIGVSRAILFIYSSNLKSTVKIMSIWRNIHVSNGSIYNIIIKVVRKKNAQ